MKIISAVALMAALAAGNAAAGDFAGAYLGGNLGVNRSSTSGTITTQSAKSPAYGLEGGYGWSVGDSVLLGVEGFVDANQQATHASGEQYGSNVYGLGLKIGVPIDSLMPYARLGYDRTRGTGFLSSFNTTSANSGLGMMYKFAPSWSVEGEWSSSTPGMSGLKLKANNFNFGLNYHFDSSAGAAAPNNKR
jgi:uncharacterized protein YhjY with autotransporter beta-barrel domain